jgi:hypothetical protein
VHVWSRLHQEAGTGKSMAGVFMGLREGLNMWVYAHLHNRTRAHMHVWCKGPAVWKTSFLEPETLPPEVMDWSVRESPPRMWTI